MARHICQHCSAQFTRPKSAAKYCSQRCSALSQTLCPEFVCAHCSTPFRRRGTIGKYCSARCFHASTKTGHDARAYRTEYYRRNREKFVERSANQYRKRMSECPVEYRAEKNERARRWLRNNPDKRFLDYAKRNIARAEGLSYADVPDDLALVAAAVLKLRCAIREALS